MPAARREDGEEPGPQPAWGPFVSPDVQALLDQITIINLRTQLFFAQENLSRIIKILR